MSQLDGVLAAIAALTTSLYAGGYDPLVVADVMEAREAVSRPFVVEYRVTTFVASGRSEIECYSGRFAAARASFLWRIWRKGPAQASGTLVDYENIIAWDGRRELTLGRPAGSNKEWRGHLRARRSPDDFVGPQLFGLEDARRPISSKLRHESARFVGLRKVGALQCVVFVADRFSTEGRTVSAPVELSLSIDHGFFPVQIVYFESADGDSRARIIDGKKFRPYAWRVASSLRRLGSGWIAARGEERVELYGSVRRIVECDEQSISHGEAVPIEAFRFDMVKDAQVRDHVANRFARIGRRVYDLSDQELDRIARSAKATGIAGPRETPALRWSKLTVVLFSVLSLVLGVWLGRRFLSTRRE